MKRTYIMLLGVFLVAGFAFRVWFAGLVPQPFVYDQEEYYGYALGILKSGLHADIYRLYGYPLVIAPLIYFFGVTTPLPWTIFHAVLDSTTALLVFFMAKKLFRNEKSAWMAYILYLINPFTAGYVGVLLSEVVATFLVTAIASIALISLEKKSRLMLFLLAFLLGFLPQVRPAFLYFSFFVFAFLFLREKFTAGIIIFVLYALPFSYNLVTNYLHYRELAPLSVDRVFARELYASLFIGRGLAFTDTEFGLWPAEALQVWGELGRQKNAAQRDEIARKYIGMAIEKIKSDPAWFVRSRIAKMGYVWEKHFVFPYNQGKPGATTKALIYWGNLFLLFTAAIGLIGWIREIGEKKRKTLFAIGIVFFFLSISTIHAISTSEERFSLPAYPLVFLFAGYGVWRLCCRRLL